MQIPSSFGSHCCRDSGSVYYVAFGDFPSLIKRMVSGLTFMIACAFAILRVSDLSPTSNIPIFCQLQAIGVPCAHIPPLPLILLFQIGTSDLIRSIAYLPASNASALCSEDTAIATLTSPIFKLPILCTSKLFQIPSLDRFCFNFGHGFFSHLDVRFIINCSYSIASVMVSDCPKKRIVAPAESSLTFANRHSTSIGCSDIENITLTNHH